MSSAAPITANLDEMVPLRGNQGLSSRGVITHGDGFVVTQEQARNLGLEKDEPLKAVIKPYRNGKDLTDSPRGVLVIDLAGLSEDDVRHKYPSVYQHLLTTVKPERDTNRDPARRKNWWLFARSNEQLRQSLFGLSRYIATVQTAKHRFFTFLESAIMPDENLIAIGLMDSYFLGVLSSRVHVAFARAAGSRLGVGNDPVYDKSRCFDPFPFPLCTEEQRARIREVAEQLDAHRKRVQAQHPDITLTGMYNVLEKLRAGVRPTPGGVQLYKGYDHPFAQVMTDRECDIHERGLVSVLKKLHNDLDEAVFAAYGWQQLWDWRMDARKMMLHDFDTGDVRLVEPDGVPGYHLILAEWEKKLDAEILRRLVTLNHQRAEEEKRGIIHWLRPEYQSKAGKSAEHGAGSEEQDELPLKPKKGAKTQSASKLRAPSSKPRASAKQPWPNPLADRIRATEAALHAAGKPVTAEDLTKHFTRAKPHDLQEILESLAALGTARRDGERFGV